MSRPMVSTRVGARADVVLYKTASLDFAAYLQATGRLQFDHAEAREHHSEFFFLDPNNEGSAILAEYYTHDIQVSAKLLFASRSLLLNEIRRRA
jgi:hypothetical protein